VYELYRNIEGTMQEICRIAEGTMQELCRSTEGTMQEQCRTLKEHRRKIQKHCTGTVQEQIA
jgi:hypothetical protein